jgi:hypothetical protein
VWKQLENWFYENRLIINTEKIQDDARANAMLLFDLIAARINLSRNVLPVPSGASKKNILPNLSETCFIISS